MQITLKMPDLERFVEEQVKAGFYPSPEDVVNGALALLRGQAQTSAAEVQELRAAIAVGVDEADPGLSEPWDADEARSKNGCGTSRGALDEKPKAEHRAGDHFGPAGNPCHD